MRSVLCASQPPSASPISVNIRFHDVSSYHRYLKHSKTLKLWHASSGIVEISPKLQSMVEGRKEYGSSVRDMTWSCSNSSPDSTSVGETAEEDSTSPYASTTQRSWSLCRSMGVSSQLPYKAACSSSLSSVSLPASPAGGKAWKHS